MAFKEHRYALLFLAVASLVVYASSLGHEFVPDWDDSVYVIANPTVKGFSREHLRVAFTTFFAGNYAPLQIVSYMLDYTLWGLAPGGFILTNILLHTLSGLLFYGLLIRSDMAKGVACAAAFIFLLHPVQVESVVWVSQRKTLLAMVFFLISFHCYLTYREGGVWKRGFPGPYLLSLACFSLALLSKSTAIILPLALLLHDRASAVREPRSTWLKDKIPYGLIAVAAGVVAFYSQDHQRGWGGRTGYHGGSPLVTFFTMMTVVGNYLKLLFWPTGLSAHYKPPLKTALDGEVVLAALVILALLAFGAYLYRCHRELFCWYALFFAGLAPVSQVIPIVTLMNDRYLYFPLLGGAPFICGLGPLLVQRTKARWRAVLLAAAGAGLLILPFLTVQRTGVWQNSLTLWQDTVAKSPDSTYAWKYLADEQYRRDDLDGALRAFRELIARSSHGSLERNALKMAGIVCTRKGDVIGGRNYLVRLVRDYPDELEGRILLAENYRMTGENDTAAVVYRQVLEENPRCERASQGLREIGR